MSEATSGVLFFWSRVSRSLSSGARSRDPLAHAGYVLAVENYLMISQKMPASATKAKVNSTVRR
jgi:hypothetical protein